MIILVIKQSDADCPHSQQITQDYPDAVITNHKQYPDKELLEADPSLIVLIHSLAVLHTKTLRATAADRHPNLRIIVVLPEGLAAQATNARIAGADVCLVSPFPAEHLQRAIYDECTAFRRLVDTAELLKTNPAIANRYAYLDILGAGQHSVMVLAKDQKKANKVVTVKLLRKSISSTADFMTEFTTNAEKLKKVSCDNFARVIDVGTWKGYGYLASDIGRCENLYTRLDKYPLSESEVTTIGLAITRALIAIRKCGIIHFNIKPENVLYDPSKKSYILSEFGLLTPFTDPDSSGFYFWSEAAFTSPEIFTQAGWLTIRSDIYSLGLLLYTCITRSNPFQGRPSDADVERRINENVIKSTDGDLAKCSSTLAVTIEGMTHVDPDRRPRLRELETIFFQSSKILSESTVTPSTPSSNTGASDTKSASAVLTDSLEAALLRRSKNSQSAASTGRAAGGRTPAAAPAPATKKKIDWRHDRKAQLRVAVVGVVVLIILSIAFRTGYRRAVKHLRPTQFEGGPLQVFTCLNGHTEEIRTLDLRNVKCPKCGEHTTPSHTCQKCKAVFGLPEWGRRHMTDEESAKFEQQQKVCPLCESRNTVPTPLKNTTQK